LKFRVIGHVAVEIDSNRPTRLSRHGVL